MMGEKFSTLFNSEDEAEMKINCFNYTPEKHGAIVAMRIYLEDGYQPMAELLPAFGGSIVIRWDSVDERKIFSKGINAYTVVFDERTEWRPFESYRKINCDYDLPGCLYDRKQP